MKKAYLIIILLILISKFVTAQIIDKYGFNLGATYSNQLWKYKFFSIDNPNKDYKLGLSAFLSSEKIINKTFSIKTEIGYIQKGFKNNYELIFVDGKSAGVDKKNVIFHDLAVNFGLKITLFNSNYKPYTVIGIRGDHMFSYKDIVFVEQASGLKFNMYEPQIKEFGEFNLSGLVGIGLEFNDLYYIEFEYNPAITSNFNSVGLQIKDNCFGFKFGININELIEKQRTNTGNM